MLSRGTLTILLTSNVGEHVFIIKKITPLKIINFNYLNECVRSKLKTDNKLSSFIKLCRSPSQGIDVFENFIYEFRLNVDSSKQPISFCSF